MGRLDGRTALISGAASGIGRGAAMLFAQEGAAIVAADIDESGGKAVVDTIKSAGGRAVFAKLDVTNEGHWESATAFAVEQYGSLNIVANVAGIGAPSDLEELTLDHWNREIAINLTGVFLGCKHGIRTIKLNGKPGAIVNLGSISALAGVSVQASYNASKGGVRVLTKAVALDCVKKGYSIRCNAVHPTYVDTGMFNQFDEMFPSREAMMAHFSQDVPIGRVCTPDDIARTMLFLASDDSAMITGTEIIVDGGHTAGIPTKF